MNTYAKILSIFQTVLFRVPLYQGGKETSEANIGSYNQGTV